MVSLAELRARRRLSQSALAERLGVTQAAISEYERGVCMPSMKTARKIAAFFGVPLDDLEFSGIPESTPRAYEGQRPVRDPESREEAAS